MFWATGEFVLVGLGYAILNWRLLTITAGSMASVVLLWSCLIPESSRWLLSQGRSEEATAIVQRIAAWNGTQLPPDVLLVSTHPADSDAQQDPAAATEEIESSPSKVKRMKITTTLHHRKLLKRTLVLIFTWFALYIVSYGVNLGSGALPGSVYVTFTLLTAAELSAQLLAVLVADKAGRHNILSLGLVVGGSACLACATTDSKAAKAVLAMFGKFGCTMGMSVLGTFTTELFATPIRASAMGIFNEAGRFGSIIAPLMLMLGSQVMPENAAFIPFLVFGLSALLAGVLTLLLPETLGAAMPESVEADSKPAKATAPTRAAGSNGRTALKQVMWPDHCVAGTPDADFAPGLLVYPGKDTILRKGSQSHIDSYSAFYDNGGFHSTGLAEMLKKEGVTGVVVVGLALDYCVGFSAIDAVKRAGLKAIVVQEANAAIGDAAATVEMLRKNGVTVVKSVKDVLPLITK
eukprot:gene13901-14019_t